MLKIRILVFLLVLLLLGFFVRNLDWHKAFTSLQQLGFRFLWLLLVTAAGYVCATVGWRYCMIDSGKALSIKDLFLVRQVGEAVSFIQPTSAVGGEAVKIFLLRQQTVNPATLIAAAFVSRTGMFLAQVLLFFMSSIGRSTVTFQLPDSIARVWPWLAGLAVLLLLIRFQRFFSAMAAIARTATQMGHALNSYQYPTGTRLAGMENLDPQQPAGISAGYAVFCALLGNRLHGTVAHPALPGNGHLAPTCRNDQHRRCLL